jgi:hypothetical protein
MTIPDLAELRRLLSEATPGPWVYGAMTKEHVWPHGWIMAEHVEKGPTHVAEMRGWGYLTGRGHGALALSSEEASAIQLANAALIVALVNAAPYLLSRIEQLEALATGAPK